MVQILKLKIYRILLNGERKIVILIFMRWRKFKYEYPIYIAVFSQGRPSIKGSRG